MTVNDLSFDPQDSLYDAPGLPGVRWGVQVFTTSNLYGLDPALTRQEINGQETRLVCEGLRWAGGQQRGAGYVEVALTQGDGPLSWRIQARHDEPIKSVKLLLWGLPDAALTQGWWTATSARPGASQGHGEWSGSAAGQALTHPTAQHPLLWRYPWPEWLTPWACAGEGPGAVCLGVRDPQVRGKRLYAHTPPYADGPVVEVVCEEDAAAWDGHFVTPDIRLRVCADSGDIDRDFAEHLAFVEDAYGLPRWEERGDVPSWLRDVRLLLNLHGQHWTGYVFNTFDRMAEALRFVTRHIPGEQVLAYLPGWEGRYYWAYPVYQPGEDMGGPDGFRRLIATARELGVHVMPMFGANGANAQRYPDWERAAFRNDTNRYVILGNCPDWDSDRAGDGDQIFLNPGEPRFREHLLAQVSAAIAAYDLDSVYLDTSGWWFNDPRYNLYAGYRALLDALRTRHPGVMVAGEGWYDALLALFPLNLSWTGVERSYRYPELLTRYGRALGHLADGAPGRGSTGVHEAGFRPAAPTTTAPGHIPSVSIVDDTLERYGDEIARICRMAAATPPAESGATVTQTKGGMARGRTM